MNNDQFTYWLQGFVEMNGGKEPTKQQWQMIKDHLKLCFNKVTPTYPSNPLDNYRQIGPYKTFEVPPWFSPPVVTCTTKQGGGGGC